MDARKKSGSNSFRSGRATVTVRPQTRSDPVLGPLQNWESPTPSKVTRDIRPLLEPLGCPLAFRRIFRSFEPPKAVLRLIPNPRYRTPRPAVLCGKLAAWNVGNLLLPLSFCWGGRWFQREAKGTPCVEKPMFGYEHRKPGFATWLGE